MNSDVAKLLEQAWNKRRGEQYADAEALLIEARGLCGADDYDALGRIYHIYMQLDYDQGNLTKALELCQKSLSYYKKTNKPDRIAHSTRHLADLQRHLGLAAESESNYRKAMGMYKASPVQQAGDLANALRGFAIVLENRKKTDEAITAWRETKTLYQSLGLEAGVDEATQRLAALQS